MRFRPTSALRAALLAVALSLAAAAPAAAQTQYSEAKLQAFVTAAIAVSDLFEKWSPQINAAESQEKAEEMAHQADSEMIAAIENVPGISLEEYTQIIQDTRQDEALSDRIRGIYQKRSGAN